ncbi:MAG: DUF1566 domain-containing protein [Thermodesulfovibrionales bacterium]
MGLKKKMRLNVISPSAPFTVTSDGCTGVTLSPSATCSVTVSFTQIAVRAFIDALRILSNDSDHPSVSIRLTAIPPRADLKGTVTEVINNISFPLGGVKVTVTDPVGTYITWTSGNEVPCTDPCYRFSFYNLTSGNFTAKFELWGYAKKTVSGVLTPGQNILDVQLTRVPPLSLSITSPQNGAILNSSPITVNGLVNNNAQVTVNGIAATVNNGTFSASISLTEGQNIITATATDQYDWTTSKSINVTLVTRGSITGVITNSSTGLPISSATVTITDSANNTHTTLTDGSGRYTIADLPPRAFTGTVTKDGFVPYVLYGSIVSGQMTLNIQLTLASTLIGRVTDSSTGTPIEGVTVTFNSSAQTLTTQTGQDGAYILTNIAAGNFTLTCNKSGYFQLTVNDSISAGETKNMDVQLTPMPLLTLTITSPVDGAVVNSSWLTVGGTVSNNANVSVNGTQASVAGGLFSVVIPLTEGANTVTATATDTYGQTVSHGITVTLTGLLDKDEIFVSPLALDFAAVRVGAARSRTLVISNIGTTNLSINQISTSPPFLVSDDDECSWQIVPPSSSCSVGIKFVPTLEGDFSGTLQIPSSDADRSVVTVSLAGMADLSLGGYLLPDTGQTDCFDSLGNITACSLSLGQDGSYTINPLFYTEDNSLTVIDKNTGLIWQREDDGTARSWTNAANYCENLSLDGHADWRLPTYFELLTIVDYGRNNPSVDPLVFPDTNSSFYWTSTTDVGGAKAISFDYGVSSTLLQSSVNSFRCVRGTELPDGFFSDNFDDTLTDWDTGLMWTDGYFSARTWNQALYLCNVMEVGGYTDWRLPDIKELLSKTYTDCYLGDCFAWSSTTFGQPDVAGDYKQAFVYDNIDIVPHDKSSTHMLRCVRGGWGTFKGVVKGKVSDSVTGLPVPSAAVSLTDSRNNTLTAITNADGDYSIADVSAGDFTIIASKAGYTSQSISDTIALSEVAIVNLSLTQQFALNTLGDYGNVTVIEMTGDYNAKNPDGSINAIPRQEIGKEFLKNHSDQYDFFVIFSNFDFAMPDAAAKAFYLEVKNDTQGIGKQIFDNSLLFGSNGKLQGTIDMGNIAKLITNPADPKFEQTISILAHEQLHRWGANVKFKDAGGNTSTALLGKDGSHWSFLLDSDGSVMYGNDWKVNADGTFRSIAANKYYSPLDLYLMGIIDKSQVPPMLLIDNAAIDPAKMPEVGSTISGTPRYITIDDVIGAEGQRVPDAVTSQKTFKTAFIFITRPGTYTGSELAGLENIRNAWAGRFANLTEGKGSIADVAPSLTIAISSPSNNETITRPDVTVKGAIINSTGNETGVTVNGIMATVYGNQFIANHVPLTEGSNTITITSTDTAGNTATTSITVNAVTTGNYIRLTSNIESGIPPLEVTLRIDGSFSITESNLNITGPVQPEIISSSPEEYTVKMTIEGVYTFTATATGPDGNIYQDTIAITVMNKTEMDNLLKAKWQGMNTALSNQDTEKASTYYSEETKQIYHDLFNSLYAYLPQIAQEMQEIQLIYLKNNTAKYRMRQNELYGGRTLTLTYYIYFVIDRDGVWKIYRY